MSHWLAQTTGWTISKIVKTLHRYRQVILTTGNHTSAAEQPLPDDLRAALDGIRHSQGD